MLSFIINIYKALMTRGILGTCVYVSDESLKAYLKEQLDATEEILSIDTIIKM